MSSNLRVVERLAWCELLLWVCEQIAVLLMWLLPRWLLVHILQAAVAKRVYACDSKSVTLYKSGRAALRGALATIRARESARSVVLVPDYTCNLVTLACRAAGLSVRTYSTTECCEPVWSELEDAIATEESPVIVFCSMFGAAPVMDEHVSALTSRNDRSVIVADECQNVVANSRISETPAHVIIFSFNDKTCPGLMGGGVIWNRQCFGPPFLENASWRMRWKCRFGLLGLYLTKLSSDVRHVVRACFRRRPLYARPRHYEFSHCKRAHYDMRAESIYKLSAARAIVSVMSLARYRRRRSESVREIRSCLDDTNLINAEGAALHAPPFVPLRETAVDVNSDRFPFPLKAPYAVPDDPNVCLRDFYSVELTAPFVRYVGKGTPGASDAESPAQDW